jgi:hypothetical protein
MHLANYLGLLHQSELELGRALLEVAEAHGHEPDVRVLYLRFADQSTAHADALAGQAAQGARDQDLLEVVRRCDGEVAAQLKWLRTGMKQAAPQALLVAD